MSATSRYQKTGRVGSRPVINGGEAKQLWQQRERCDGRLRAFGWIVAELGHATLEQRRRQEGYFVRLHRSSNTILISILTEAWTIVAERKRTDGGECSRPRSAVPGRAAQARKRTFQRTCNASTAK
jgi:hypothetical protein